MTITVKYFGAVADATGKKEEEFHFEAAYNSLQNIKSELEEHYPGLTNISYSFALNKSIEKGDAALNENDELALLPPFAGG